MRVIHMLSKYEHVYEKKIHRSPGQLLFLEGGKASTKGFAKLFAKQRVFFFVCFTDLIWLWENVQLCYFWGSCKDFVVLPPYILLYV